MIVCESQRLWKCVLGFTRDIQDNFLLFLLGIVEEFIQGWIQAHIPAGCAPWRSWGLWQRSSRISQGLEWYLLWNHKTKTVSFGWTHICSWIRTSLFFSFFFFVGGDRLKIRGYHSLFFPYIFSSHTIEKLHTSRGLARWWLLVGLIIMTRS